MEVLAKKIVSQWVKQGLVEESQAEWYVYGLLERLTTLCTFCVVVTLGSLVSTIWQSILFAIALMLKEYGLPGYFYDDPDKQLGYWFKGGTQISVCRTDPQQTAAVRRTP